MPPVSTSAFLPGRSFLIGLGSVLDIAGGATVVENHATAQEADRSAMAKDWAIVGQEILNATAKLAQEHGASTLEQPAADELSAEQLSLAL